MYRRLWKNNKYVSRFISEQIINRYIEGFFSKITTNDLNRFHIELENVITPRERDLLIDFISNLPKSLMAKVLIYSFLFGLFSKDISFSASKLQIKAVVSWGNRFKTNKERLGLPSSSSEWERNELRPGVRLFRQMEHKNTGLVLAFTGRLRRMMMGSAEFLDLVGQHEADILLIEGRPHGLYLEGIGDMVGGLGSALNSLAEFIASELHYDTFCAIGASAGSAPALISSRFLPVSWIVAASPPSWNATWVPDDWRTQNQLVLASRQNCEVVVLLGEKSKEHDVHAANEWGALYGAKVVEVPDRSHANLGTFMKSPQFANLMSALK